MAGASCEDGGSDAPEDPTGARGVASAVGSAKLAQLVAACPALLGGPGSGEVTLRESEPSAGSGLEATCRDMARCPTLVRLPPMADEAASIIEPGSAVAAHFTVRDANPSPVQAHGALALYEGALPGADLVHRAGPHGTEDFFHFAARPKVEAIRYEVELENVRALRLVGGVLEMLDRKGVPRLRVSRPYVIDAGGRRLDAALSVDGCPVDRDPRAPWARPIDAMTESTCEVVVDWSETGATYPLLVDPEWKDAGNMINARTHHSATFLPDVGILLAGGFDVDGAPLSEAEIMCPAELCLSNSFAATDDIGQARGAHTATRTGDGNVLIVGGRNARDAGTPLAGTAIYTTEEGEFAAGPAMARARDGHTATLVGRGGKVLIAGGDGTSPSTAEVFDPADEDFQAPIPMTTRRGAHCAEALATPGLVLLAGGIGAGGFTLQSAEVYDEGDNAFAAVTGEAGVGANMTATRAFATATLLEDGRVLITGGTNGSGIFYSTADIFEPGDAGGGRFRQQPVLMEAPRAFHAATKLLGTPGVPGKVLLTGGFNGSVALTGSEVFDAEAVGFELASTMIKARAFHSATILPSGQVLVAGGGYDLATVDQPTAQSTEILQRKVGEVCAEGTECATGFCPGEPNGICCNRACEATCETCATGECETVPDETPVKPVCSNAVQFLLICQDGEVSAGAVKTCDAFGCNGEECADSCEDDSSCSEVGYCTGSTCLPKQEIGGSCDEDRECLGSFCADGVCCNARCDKQCQACDVADSLGVCQQNEGPPRPGHTPCEGAGGPCEGMCGTSPDECDYEPKSCSEGSCAVGQLAIGRCHVDAVGTCTEVTEACEPFACNEDGNACAATCTTSADCAPGRACNASQQCVIVEAVQCDGDRTVVSPDGTTRDCSPLKCREGACLSRCGSIDDCTAPSVCDESGSCVDPPEDPPVPEGCSAASGGSPAGYAAWLALAALVVARRRSSGAEVSR